jgi:hypothetical protein
MITQTLFTLFCTVFFCLGLYITSREGYILDFLQKPFIKAENMVELYKFKEVLTVKDQFLGIFYWLLSKVAPAIIMCITCMGSVWGFVVFVSLNGLHAGLIPYLIINCFAAAFIQTFIWSLYAKYIL